ncbi:AAA family ATPase, partial [Tepidimonas sediminis]|uniref:AAA family ATPase n=1 Tax=Tepidimonas sediminis TaxID=2588941 RepID=UPI00117EBE82
RVDLAEIESLIEAKRYFVLHAPRQTGKTTALLALMEHLNRQGRYRALYANIETAQAARGQVERGVAAACNAIALAAATYLNDHSLDTWLQGEGRHTPAESLLTRLLARWSTADPAHPAVLLLDEVDALIGDTLISLLRQIRAGYAQRPMAFPQTVVLCGVRDVRDYRIHSGDGEII